MGRAVDAGRLAMDPLNVLVLVGAVEDLMATKSKRPTQKPHAVDLILQKWAKNWDLTTIPDNLLTSEYKRRIGSKGGRPRIEDPATEAKRAAERERIAKLRERQRAELALSIAKRGR